VRRCLLVLVAGTILLGATAPMAIAGDGNEVPKPSDKVTTADWIELGELMAELDTTLASAESIVTSAADLDWRYDECRFQSLDNPTWTQREERLTAQCAVRRWSVPGGLAKFMSEGYCESGYNRLAYNPNGHLGIYQHDAGSYQGRMNMYRPTAWDFRLSNEWRNSRGHIVMTAIYVHRNGWGAWDRYNSC
jgi:hypothetical protein